MRKIKRFVQLINDPTIDPDLIRAITLVLHAYDTSFSMRLGVHFILFKTALEGGGTEEQIKKYAEDIQLRINSRVCISMNLTHKLQQEDEGDGLLWHD